MATGVVIVQQYQRMVVQKFGTYIGTFRPGFHFLIPIMYNGTKVDLRERVARVPTQKYITSDNVVVDMDFVIYYRVMDDLAERAVLEVQNFELAVVNLAFATLRAVIGATTLAEALTEREKMRDQLQVRMDEVTERWGVKVSQVEINEIDPPPGVKAGHGTGEVGRGYQDRRHHRIRRPAPGCDQPGRGRKAGCDPSGRRYAAIRDSPGGRRPASSDSSRRGIQRCFGQDL